ncbi:MAG: hypothetical protein V4607_01875 [Pseudomonadota bacterium]
MIASNFAGIRKFFQEQWFGQEDCPELDEAMTEIEGHDFEDDGSWETKFEIGGIEIRRVYFIEEQIELHFPDWMQKPSVRLNAGDTFILKADSTYESVRDQRNRLAELLQSARNLLSAFESSSRNNFGNLAAEEVAGIDKAMREINQPAGGV